jgi:hypothetical protein
MGDFMDRVQEREQTDREVALEEQRRKLESGVSECIHPDCTRSISDVRRALGARLCLEHQQEKEAEQRRRGERSAI